MKRLAGLSALCIVVFFGCKKQDHSTSANNKVSDSASNSFIITPSGKGNNFAIKILTSRLITVSYGLW